MYICIYLELGVPNCVIVVLQSYGFSILKIVILIFNLLRERMVCNVLQACLELTIFLSQSLKARAIGE